MKTTIILLTILLLNACGAARPVPKHNKMGTFKDKRDGQIYQWVKIGKKIWMAQNLNYGIPGSSWYYDNKKENRDLYGLLYDYKSNEAIQKVCPKGWHIPIDEEWQDLERAVGMSNDEASGDNWRGSVADNLLKGGSSGFNVLLGGYYKPDNFYYLGEHAYFWSSSNIGGFPICTRIFYKGDSRIMRGGMGRAYGLSVRCVKDDG